MKQFSAAAFGRIGKHAAATIKYKCSPEQKKPRHLLMAGLFACLLCTEERIVHVILVSAAPVDAAGEAVFFKNPVDLAAHRDGVLTGGGGEKRSDTGLSAGVAIVVLVGVDVNGQAAGMFRSVIKAISAEGVTGIFGGTGVDFAEDLIHRSGDVAVHGQGELTGIFLASLI